MKINLVKTRYVNTYVIEETAGMFIVDVASRCDGFVLRHIQKEMNRSLHDVILATCTHDDPDHIGGVVRLAKACHATAAIPHASKRGSLKLYRNPLGPFVRTATTVREAFRERSKDMYLNSQRNARYGHVPNHHLKDPVTQRFVMPRQRLRDGARLESFPDWEVIHTPGHSWDSICFFHHPTGSLISGDTLLGSGSQGQLVHPAISDNAADMRRTLRKLRKLSPASVYPGHGSIFSGDRLLDHL